MKKKRVRLRITCGTDDCSKFEQIINIINFEPGDKIEAFIESYGNGSEDQHDYCPECHNLGILGDPS
jgi:hypothetical protein